MGGKLTREEVSRDKEIVNARNEYLDELLKNSAKLEDDNSDLSCKRERSRLDEKAQAIDPKDCLDQYPFENLVFEGGGSKGLAYIGAIKVLEDLGLMQNIKRFAGTSSGALTATFLALEYSSEEIREFYINGVDDKDLNDASIFSLLPNLLCNLGLYPGKTLLGIIGTAIQKKTGNKDSTFRDIYTKTKKELCIVVTNVNECGEEYCHVKTTPDMPVQLAVRMSMGIPGYFQPLFYSKYGTESCYVDGGVVLNYPVYCFDGWWLSMEKGDDFYTRSQSLNDAHSNVININRFYSSKSESRKTLGFVVYGDLEKQTNKHFLEHRIGTELGKLPDTPLARKYQKKFKQRNILRDEHRMTIEAVEQFQEILKRQDLDQSKTISRTELEKALSDENFSKENQARLFGKLKSSNDVLQLLDKDNDGEISQAELTAFIQEASLNVQRRYFSYSRQQFDGVVSFLMSVMKTVLNNGERISQRDGDIERTVGINTGHIVATDFELHDDDKAFLIEQGYKSTLASLKYIAATYELEREKERM